jgi:prolyl oligopeptidase
MTKPDPRPTVDAPDDDPYLWLEEIEGPEALAWVEDQNAKTLAEFGGENYEKERRILVEILDRPDKIPYVTRRGGFLYNFWRDKDHPRGLWRCTTMSEFVADDPPWEILIDVDALAEEDGEDWVWQGATTLLPSHDRAMIRLSRGGSDACVLREFDLLKKIFVEDGFRLPEAKGGVEWLDIETLLLTSAHGGEPFQTRSGYARTVRLWKRGTEPSEAPILFEIGANNMSAGAFVDRMAEEERVYFSNRKAFFEGDEWIGDRTGAQQKLALPSDAWCGFHGDWFVLKTRSDWQVGETTYPPDMVLGGRLDGLRRGAPELAVLFQGSERVALQEFFWAGGALILSILDNLSPRYDVLMPTETGWQPAQISGLPKSGIVAAWRFDMEEKESDGDLLVNIQDPLTPPTLHLVTPGSSPAPLKASPPAFNAEGLVISRHEAPSVDGELIPYIQIGPAAGSGDAPVLMSGYGGFAVINEPFYDPAVGKLWLERGGTHVVTHIRGGGEFGTRWHEAGRKAGKRLSHDDFAAIAAHLVERGVTTPKRIAARGGSNGGILITNMLTRYPERFGALFCSIPLIDMRRYTHLLAGASWIDEYGDPEKPEDWAFLQNYSAYHNAAPGRDYPPILIATSRRDDRVHPGHARKMAAKLQAMGYDAHFYEPAAGGHSAGKNNQEQANFLALELGFLRRAIGWHDASGQDGEAG